MWQILMVVTATGLAGLTAVSHVVEALECEQESVPTPLPMEEESAAIILDRPEKPMAAMTLFAPQVSKSFSSLSRFVV